MRFRVEAELWNDLSPEKTAPPDEEENEDEDKKKVARASPAYALEGSMQEGGLGPVLWWQAEE